MATPLKVFISYSQNKVDRPLLDHLLRHTAPLVQAGKITVWEDTQILPSQPWEKAIKDNLEQADIVVLLVSSDYMASDFINRVEVPMAMQRQEAGNCVVVPVLLRSCLFDLMPYARYGFLPKSMDDQRLIPVDKWTNTDEAFSVVVHRLHELTRQLYGENDPIPDAASPIKVISALSELERHGLEQQLSLATQKLQRLQTAHLLETDPSRQFALEHEIQKLETLVGDLKSKGQS